MHNNAIHVDLIAGPLEQQATCGMSENVEIAIVARMMRPVCCPWFAVFWRIVIW
jgi:hypothetical protein